MEDANLIACLYPHKKSRGARRAISNPQNISQFVPRLLQKPEPLLGRESRESTAPLEENKNEPPAYFYEDGLQLTFSHGPKGDKGFALRINQNEYDIVLPKLGEIKKLHGYFTFNDENRFIWRDSSIRGTIITYDGKEEERRRKFTWILSKDKVPDKKTEEIVIELHEYLKFQIVISKHDTHPDQYIANVEQFRAEIAVQDEPRISILGMHSPGSTAPHSNAHTPNQGRIVLKQRTLGKGAFAVMTHSWDVSTGIEYACKKPRNRERFDRGSWEKEIDIMSKIRHVSRYDEIPLPCLYLEYLPFGNLEYQHRKRHISYEESLTILHQSLSALEYLHGRKTPIVHRDIKPENILVLTRDPLHIKLADFGLAKAGGSLTTFCGTETYCPPEIAKYFGLSKSVPKDKYTEAVDIWSLGVVILRFALPDLPHPGSGEGIDWCEKIIDEVNDYDDDLIDFLSTAMLVMRPESRYSAQACLDRVEELFIPSRGGSLTPTPASYPNGYETMAAGYHVEERLAEERLAEERLAEERLAEEQPISSCDVSISKPSYSEYVAKQELSGLLL
ncbi:kinase-like protein [Zopfia rhizophila CBS 207.26]|uniref:Kinase-like protein n=1 Tax=Zopfia rhizophila CBS 207.26 TaxID=1314779 RepID=A0A6A6DTI1_9PEZI|nr:kinase-like protein [Zopfia rhizophila CBS 207.26]